MIYDPTANPAKNFGAFSKRIMNKAEELGTDKIEFIDKYIKYLEKLIAGKEANMDGDIGLYANTPKDFLKGLIMYLEKIKIRYQSAAKKEANKDKIEKGKEEVRENYKQIFQEISQKSSNLEEQLKQLKGLLEEKKNEKGKISKTVLEEIQKEIAKTQEAIKENARKEREIKEKRDDWHQFLDGIIGNKADSMAVLEHLQVLLEQQKSKKSQYGEIAVEEIEKAIRHVETSIKENKEKIEKNNKDRERKFIINKNRKYLMNILYFTNGFVSIAQSPLISEFGRTFSLDVSEFERFSKLNSEIRGELKLTEEEQIKSLIKKKTINNSNKKEIIEAVEDVLEDKQCQEIIEEMKKAETKYRFAKITLNDGYKMTSKLKQEEVQKKAKKELKYADNMKKDIESDDSLAAAKLNKVLSSNISTDILVLKLREREIERSKPKVVEEER